MPVCVFKFETEQLKVKLNYPCIKICPCCRSFQQQISERSVQSVQSSDKAENRTPKQFVVTTVSNLLQNTLKKFNAQSCVVETKRNLGTNFCL